MSTALALLMTGVVAWDLVLRRVPNGLVLLGSAGAIGAWWLGAPFEPLSGTQLILGGLLGLAGLLPFYAMGQMGAGDVKFAAMLGLWLGPVPLLLVWLSANLMGGLHLTLWWLLRRWCVLPGLMLALAGSPGGRHPTGMVANSSSAKTCRTPLAGYMAIATLVWMVLRQGA